MKTDIEIIAKSYDEVPYHSKVHLLSLPESLYMASLVHGLKAADIESATVLEIGCAAGVNIISFAANYPKASVVGVDLSKENIKNANNLAKNLELKNAKFIESDIKEITSKIGKFDYIIAHGIYSWVSDEVKDAILRVMGECLNDKGVAYLSFNAYPGWKTKETIRDIMKFRIESKGEIDADNSIALGFDALAYVKNNAVNPLVRQVIDSEYDNITSKEKNYIMHECFEYYNSPNYLYEVAKDAKKHGLNYLCDTEYSQGIFLPIKDELKEALLKEADGDRARFEQFIDFLTNRTFRRSLFVKDTLYKDVDYDINIKFTTLDELYMSGQFQYDVAKKRYINLHNDVVMPTGMHQIFDKLNEVYPSNLNVKELVSSFKEEEKLEIYRNLAYLLCSRTVNFSLKKESISKSKTPKLKDISLKLFNFIKDLDIPLSFFTPRYSNVALDKNLDTHILPLIDGKRDRNALVNEVIKLEEKDVFKFVLEDRVVTDQAKIKELAQTRVDTLLDLLLREGCLV